MTDKVSLRDALNEASRDAQAFRDARRNADEVVTLRAEIARLRAELDRRGPLVCSGCGVHEHDHETYCGEPSYERQSSDDGSTSPDRCGEWISRGEYDLRADLDRRPEITPEDAALRAHAQKARPVCTCTRRLGDYCPTPDPNRPVHAAQAVKT